MKSAAWAVVLLVLAGCEPPEWFYPNRAEKAYAECLKTALTGAHNLHAEEIRSLCAESHGVWDAAHPNIQRPIFSMILSRLQVPRSRKKRPEMSEHLALLVMLRSAPWKTCACYVTAAARNLKPWELGWSDPPKLRQQLSHCVCRAHIDMSRVENPRRYLVKGTTVGLAPLAPWERRTPEERWEEIEREKAKGQADTRTPEDQERLQELRKKAKGGNKDGGLPLSAGVPPPRRPPFPERSSRS